MYIPVSEFAIIVFLLIGNIIVMAISYGKLQQKVKDLCRRVDRIEKHINGQINK